MNDYERQFFSKWILASQNVDILGLFTRLHTGTFFRISTAKYVRVCSIRIEKISLHKSRRCFYYFFSSSWYYIHSCKLLSIFVSKFSHISSLRPRFFKTRVLQPSFCRKIRFSTRGNKSVFLARNCCAVQLTFPNLRQRFMDLVYAKRLEDLMLGPGVL